MIGTIPSEARYGVYCKPGKESQKQAMKNNIIKELSVDYILPSPGYLSLRELIAAKDGKRYLPKKDKDIWNDHVERFKAQRETASEELSDGEEDAPAQPIDGNQPPADQQPKEQTAPYFNAHLSPSCVYKMANVFLASIGDKCLIKPGKGDGTIMFPMDYLLYCVRCIDPKNILKVFWTHIGSIDSTIPPKTFIDQVATCMFSASEELNSVMGFDVANTKTYNDALALTNLAAVAEKAVTEIPGRRNAEEVTLIMKKRMARYHSRLKNSVSTHYEIYLGHCSSKAATPMTQPEYILNMVKLLEVAYTLQPGNLPIHDGMLRKVLMVSKKRFDLLSTYLTVVSKLVHWGVVSAELFKLHGTDFTVKLASLVEHLDKKEGKAVNAVETFDIDEVEKVFLSYNHATANPDNPLGIVSAGVTPKPSPAKLLTETRPLMPTGRREGNIDDRLNKSMLVESTNK